MTVYLLHLDQPLSRGTSKRGTPLKAGHYIGYTEDLVGRMMEHQETTWEPLPEPQVSDAGKLIRSGTTHGPGATFMGVVNFRGIHWRLARTWDGADPAFERRLKKCKMAPRLCPVCNPHALKRMQLEDLRP